MQLHNPLSEKLSTVQRSFGRFRNKQISLSTYFPKGTQFLYGYPSGTDSGFLNLVPPSIEELVAARVIACSGPNIKPICFAATTPQVISTDLFNSLGIALPKTDTLVMPPEIGLGLTGDARNRAVKAWIKNNIDKKSLIMSQPFTDPDLSSFYQIPPSTTAYLNDKYNMTEYIGEDWLPKRLAVFSSGEKFSKATTNIPLPCVIKATLSSSGDGVHICKNRSDLQDAAEKFKQLDERIVVEQYIEIKKNYCIQFGIPHDSSKKAQFIGCNEQVIGPGGIFLGGRLTLEKMPASARPSVQYAMNTVIPRVRSLGWYGIFGLDVLIDSDNKSYFIDPNFRMTGTAVYLFLDSRGKIKRPMTSISGEFRGTEAEFRSAILPIAGTSSSNRILKLICLSRHDNIWRFDAALEYKTESQLKERAKTLITRGVKSKMLELLCSENLGESVSPYNTRG